MKKNLSIVTSLLFFALLLVPSGSLSAQDDTINTFKGGLNKVKTDIVEPDGALTSENTTGILKNIIDWLLSIAAILALTAIIIGGIWYIVSIGDENKAKQAKQIIMYAVIGLIIVGISFAIIATIDTILIGD